MSDLDGQTSTLDHNTPIDASRGRQTQLPTPSRRRDKPQLSCNLCRRRKLRCNRQQPCGTCASRGLDLSCSYASNSHSPSNREGSEPSRSLGSIQDRIQQLEKLVVTLMQKTALKDSHQEGHPQADTATSASDVLESVELFGEDGNSPSHSDYGSMKLDTSGISYVSSAHWTAVLDGIVELKDHFEKEDEIRLIVRNSDPSWPDVSGPQLLYGCPKHATKEEIVAAIPLRPVVDRLISRYFNALDMAPAVLHSGQFLKEYEIFWENPSSAPVMWLGLLFTMMCLATQFQLFSLDPESPFQTTLSSELDPQAQVNAFREKIVQCLILGQYTKSRPYVLETLLLYFTIEHFLCKDAEIGIWILLGIIVHLAIRMGHHRDPSHFLGLSPFTGEMRKRLWATILQLDLVISAQMGLPRMIKEWQTDTGEPRNLLDTDFDDQVNQLPPSRPDTETTPILYVLAKNRIISVLGIISDFMTDTRPYSYAEVMRVDKRLQNAYLTIPSSLKWRPMAQSITDPPQVIMQRIYLEITFYKAQIVLHRKYLIRSRMQGHYIYSRGVCLDAALRILEYQHILDEETRPVGQLYQVRWKVSSLVNHDFLLATSILCIYLRQSNGVSKDIADGTRLEKIKQLLRRSYEIWLRSSTFSREAQKAVEALSIVLKNLDAINSPNSPGNLSSNFASSSGNYSGPISYQGKNELKC